MGGGEEGVRREVVGVGVRGEVVCGVGECGAGLRVRVCGEGGGG